jgi:phosphopantothenoylcysteine decarboxylase/phosphopantothenate--cysteine ligase
VTLVEPEEGELACRWEGKGRLASLEAIASAVHRVLGRGERLAGRHVVVAAGPTREAIDPVRYLSNHSSGKMGYRLAEAARDRGARVTVVSGPVGELPPDGVKLVPVTSASGMKRAVDRAAKTADAVIMAAAVADYRPVKASRKKIPREGPEITLRLESTPDILKGVPRKKGRVIVGFALETDQGLERARQKLEEKGCDLIVLNDPTREDSAFGGDTNQVTLIDARGRAEELPTLTKREVAERILDRVEKLWDGKGKPAKRGKG